MLLYLRPLPTDKYLYYFPNKVWKALFSGSIVSVQASFPEAAVLTFFTFLCPCFSLQPVRKQLCHCSCHLCMENLHPPFPKQFIAITLMAGRAIFSICSYCCPEHLQSLMGQETQTKNAVNHTGLTSIEKKKKKGPSLYAVREVLYE